MIEGHDLKSIIDQPLTMIRILEREAIAAMKLKPLNLEK
jgi:hypothetical protein